MTADWRRAALALTAALGVAATSLPALGGQGGNAGTPSDAVIPSATSETLLPPVVAGALFTIIENGGPDAKRVVDKINQYMARKNLEPYKWARLMLEITTYEVEVGKSVKSLDLRMYRNDEQVKNPVQADMYADKNGVVRVVGTAIQDGNQRHKSEIRSLSNSEYSRPVKSFRDAVNYVLSTMPIPPPSALP